MALSATTTSSSSPSPVCTFLASTSIQNWPTEASLAAEVTRMPPWRKERTTQEHHDWFGCFDLADHRSQHTKHTTKSHSTSIPSNDSHSRSSIIYPSCHRIHSPHAPLPPRLRRSHRWPLSSPLRSIRGIQLLPQHRRPERRKETRHPPYRTKGLRHAGSGHSTNRNRRCCPHHMHHLSISRHSATRHGPRHLAALVRRLHPQAGESPVGGNLR